MARLSLDITPAITIGLQSAGLPETLQMLRDSIELNNRKLEAFLVANTVPTGTIAGFPTTILPSTWLECNGGIVPAAYSDLIAYLGGTTLPDYRGYALVGKDGSTFGTLGAAVGSKDSVAVHDHDDPGHTHYHNHTGDTDGPNTFHNHGPDGQICISHAGAANGLVGSPVEKATFSSLDVDGNHFHPFTSLHDNTSGSANIQPAGTDDGNIQPSKAVIWGIKT